MCQQNKHTPYELHVYPDILPHLSLYRVIKNLNKNTKCVGMLQHEKFCSGEIFG